MVGISTRQAHFDLNAVRTLAVFGIVFQHTLGTLLIPRYPASVSFLLYGRPSLTVLLLFSGMSMGMMRLPATLRDYPRYLWIYARGHMRVFTVFFVVQTAVIVVNYQFGVDRGVGSKPFHLSNIVKAYILGDSYGAYVVWYMWILAMVVVVWPLTRVVRRVPVYVVVGGLLVIVCLAGYWIRVSILPDSLSGFIIFVTTIYLGSRAGWLRNGNHKRQVWIFGALYVVINVVFLMLLRDKVLYWMSRRPFQVSVIDDPLRAMIHAISIISRFCGAFFLIPAVGMIGGRLSALRAWFARGAQASLYIFLMHGFVLLVCHGLLVNHVRHAMMSWGALPKLAVILLGAVLLAMIGYYVEAFARRHPRLNYLVFGRGRRPQPSGRT